MALRRRFNSHVANNNQHRPLLEPLEARQLLTFLPPVNYSTLPHAHNVASADFNGDGAMDLAVSNSDFGNGTTIGVRLNNGNGTFGNVVNFSGGASVYWVIAGEFNNDGKADLGVVNFNRVNVLLGNGDGRFQAPKSSTTSSGVVQMAAADLNADGNQDLVATNSLSGPGINVLLGNGNGTFKPFKKFRAGPSPWGVTIGDFDHDTVPDVVVANMIDLNAKVSFLRGLGDGTFARPVSFLAFGRDTRHVASGDFNSDGHLDLVAANVGNVSIILGNGDGTFLAPKPHKTRGGANDLALADFDVNGTLDVATVDYRTPLGYVTVLLGKGNGTLGRLTKYPVGTAPFGLVAAPLNNDAYPDVAAVNANSSNMSVLINAFETPPPLPAVARISISANETPVEGDFMPIDSARLAAGDAEKPDVPERFVVKTPFRFVALWARTPQDDDGLDAESLIIDHSV